LRIPPLTPSQSAKFKSFNSLGSIADTSLTTPLVLSGAIGGALATVQFIVGQPASRSGAVSAFMTCEWDVVEVDELNQNVKVFRLTAWAELPLFGRLAGGGLFVR
jgi:hypothetical protein